MARFVQLTTSDGKERRVNPEQVVEIVPLYSDSTMVELSNGKHFFVGSAVNVVQAKLSGSR